MYQWVSNIKRAIAVILPVAVLVSCHINTTRLALNLPRRASIKIETGASITFCSADRSECKTKRIMLGSGSGVIISHHRDNSFTLTAGHVCHFSTETPSLPEFNSPEDIQGISKQMGLDLKFTPTIIVARWVMYVIDIDLNRHNAIPVSVIVPQRLNASGTSADLCLMISQRINVSPAKLSVVQPQAGGKIYNISSPYGTLFQGEGGMTYEGILSSVDGANGSSVFSIPAAPGSSGSPIFNFKGDLIGIVSAIHLFVPNYTIGPNLRQIKCFLYNAFSEGNALSAAPYGVGCED
jgi:hypothetical protein